MSFFLSFKDPETGANINALEGYAHGNLKRRLATHGTACRSDKYIMEEAQYLLFYLNLTRHSFTHTFLIFSYFLNVSNPVTGEAPTPKYPKQDFSNVYECESIIDDKMEDGERQFLCKWKHYPYYEATWVKQQDVESNQKNIHFFVCLCFKHVFFFKFVIVIYCTYVNCV